MLRQFTVLSLVFSTILVAGCAQNVEQPQPRTQTIYVYPAQGHMGTPDQWTDYKPYKPCPKVAAAAAQQK